jgi:hypothetical protein
MGQTLLLQPGQDRQRGGFGGKVPHLSPVETIDLGIEMLTGMPAGEGKWSGGYPDEAPTIEQCLPHRRAPAAPTQPDW